MTVLAFFVGGFLGMLLAALLCAAGRSDSSYSTPEITRDEGMRRERGEEE